MSLRELTACKIREKFKKKEVKPSEILEACFKEIESRESKINSFITIFKESARKQAKELDRELEKKNEIPFFFGIPIAVKDNIFIKGYPSTCASKILENYIPAYDATVIEKLKENHCIFIGKTNMDEFAMGSSNEYSAFGNVSNPFNYDYVPGGSSGGSAAAVASGFAIAALGSDTGGSVRQPASFCGVVGLKPSYGRVSRYGLVAYASSLDQIGTITKDVKDAWELFKIISGYDKRDKTSKNIPLRELSPEKKFTFGIPEEAFSEGVDDEVKKIITSAVELVVKEKKFPLKKISLKILKYAIPTYYIIACAEASSNLERYDGVKYGTRIEKNELEEMYKRTRGEKFGKEVLRRIFMGGYVLRTGYYEKYYIKAQKARRLIYEHFLNNFQEVDIIIMPTSPFPPFKKGEKLQDPISLYLADIFTVSVNLAGLPAISIPCGWTKQKLPVGVQMIGKFFDEESLLSAALSFEEVLALNGKN